MTATESQIEHDLIEKLKHLKYTYRKDIQDREGLEKTSARTSRGLIVCI